MARTVPELFDAFVKESRATLAIAGASAELSLTGKLDAFLTSALDVVATRPLHVSQQTTTDFGVPDFRVDQAGELLGWIEFKAVLAKDLTNLKGHDKKQRDLFVAGLHNLVLTDGWQWELYQDSKRVKRVTFDRDLFQPGFLFTGDPDQLAALSDLLDIFATFELGQYDSVDNAVAALAMRAKALNIALVELGPTRSGAHLNQLRNDFDALLYRNGQPFTWAKFVDSYVQIAAFGALLWHLEAGTDISLAHQVALKPGVHPLLTQCLSILWSPQSQVPTMTPLLEELCRTVNLIPPALFTKVPFASSRRKYVPDPIVHAYEPFFRRYDQASREANGVYYTPVEIVQQIVSGIDELLRSGLGREAGILDDTARFLDPATGTGTFLLGLANEIAHEADLAGLPTDQVVREVLTTRTSAFELFPGPYTIAHQRLEALLAALGTPATHRLPIYLADTLATPESGHLPMSGFGPAGDEILAERERADWIKTGEDLLVILGNPPYERLKTENGGWDVFASTLMQQVVAATPIERRSDLKSATDLYVAFWAWSLWALRSPADRQATSPRPIISTPTNHGIVAFISNRTWIIGPSLVGLRNLVRRGAKEVWVYDLGGDARGGAGARSFAGGDANVFGIQTGVAIVWLVFDREYTGDPVVRYRRLYGSRSDKLTELAEPFGADQFDLLDGDDLFVPVRWPAILRSAPALSTLFSIEPFTGIQSARDTSTFSPWGVDAAQVYAETRSRPTAPHVRSGVLGEWARLSAPKRRDAWATAQTRRSKKLPPDPISLDPKRVRPALYRPLDVRSVYDDPSWIDWYREDLHAVYSTGAVPTIISLPRDFGAGPAVIHTSLLPDQHAFKGQAGGKGVFPLWLPNDGQPDDGRRIVGGKRCTFTDKTLDWAHRVFAGSSDPAQDAYDYVLALLSPPAYTESYWQELEALGPRVPLVDDTILASRVVGVGRRVRLAWEKDVPTTGLRWSGKGSGELGRATLRGGSICFDNGRTITGVPPGAWSYTVSHYRVLPEWFAARTHWTATIAEASACLRTIAAAAGLVALAPELNAILEAVVGPPATPVIATSAIADRRMRAASDFKRISRITDGPIELPIPDVAIDIDCEHKDGTVYLWGATLTRRGGPQQYRAFADWTMASTDAERVLCQEFVDWLLLSVQDADAAHESLVIYHYSSTEPTNLRRILSSHADDQTKLAALMSRMVDVLQVVRDNFAGTASQGLKTIGRHLGANWRAANASGADTLRWVDEARGSGPAAENARVRILEYNEDDTLALGTVRLSINEL